MAAKLTLAFLFVSVIGVALVAVFVSRRAQSEFDRFVLDRYQLDLLTDLAAYYEQNEGWDGFSGIVVRAPDRRPGRPPSSLPAPVVLTDAEGTVIYGGRRYQAGSQLAQDTLTGAVPVEVDGQRVGWVLFGEVGRTAPVSPQSPELRFLAGVNRAVLFGALGAMVVALLLGLLLARSISRPVSEVTAATRQMADGELGIQVPVRTQDELGQLADAFNRMSADLGRATAQRRQMTADIAHDLRNPLSVLLGYLEALSAGKLEADPDTLAVMYERGRQLQHLVDDLRILALADAGELALDRRPVSAQTLLEHAALAHMVQARQRGIALSVRDADGESLPPIHVDPQRLAQVLSNLVANALRFTPADGRIELAARREDDLILLQVSDSGAGIDPDDLPHIFERFYRGDKARPADGQSGLGLAIAKGIVAAHGGHMRAVSTLGQGTTITAAIPIDRERPKTSGSHG
ncbi:MAG: ATP-binding protein [Candidatus Promineifilaceae bacterium]|nr:ATP-binding protein [Candidatus Promineifilaceae bacterium]